MSYVYNFLTLGREKSGSKKVTDRLSTHLNFTQKWTKKEEKQPPKEVILPQKSASRKVDFSLKKIAKSSLFRTPKNPKREKKSHEKWKNLPHQRLNAGLRIGTQAKLTQLINEQYSRKQSGSCIGNRDRVPHTVRAPIFGQNKQQRHNK